MNITLMQMQALDAAVTQGSFQAAAKFLNKTHPSVITSLKNLEAELGFTLFDRSGYRTTLTEAGKAFHKSVRKILGDIRKLDEQALHIKGQMETELNVVIGDITPLPVVMQVLRQFARDYPHTHLNLYFGNLLGPNELLFDGKADLIVHHIEKSDPRYEYREFCQVNVIPVCIPGFFEFPIPDNLKYEEIRDYTQCLIRDTATHMVKANRFVIENAPHITVGDQYTKKEVIMQGMGWGHMPQFLINQELEEGLLISLEGKFIKSIQREIVIARLSEKSHGIMAERLWNAFI